MASRLDVCPHHLLRAVLDVGVVREVLAHLGAPPDDVRATLDRRLLAEVDVLDDEVLNARGIDLPTLLAALNPALGAPPAWEGRRLTAASRDALVVALREASSRRGQAVHGGHVLLGLMTGRTARRDRLVSGTLAEHRLETAAVRDLLERWGPRAHG